MCVVGAGAAGLTVAHELERLGHRAVVLESAGDIAGKAASAEVDGHVYDLGAHICTMRYVEVAALLDELGLESEPITPIHVHDLHGGRIVPSDPAFFQRGSMERYLSVRREEFPDLGRPGLAHSAAVLARPAGEWLREHGLTSMAGTLGPGYSSCGYGFLTGDLPALYFLKYAEMAGVSEGGRWVRGHPVLFTVKGGLGLLWRRVAERLTDVRTGVRVDSIERGPEGVTVRVRPGETRREGGSGEEQDTAAGGAPGAAEGASGPARDAGPEEIVADDLVLTVALDRVLPLLDATEDERDLASRVRTIDYRTVLCRASDLPPEGFYILPSTAEEAAGGRCVAYHSRYAGQDVYTCYCYGGGLGPAALVEVLRGDLAQVGGVLREVLRVEPWAYMPHFGGEDLAAGIYDRVEALQGRNRTYQVGSLPAFELLESNIAYARDIVHRFFIPS